MADPGGWSGFGTATDARDAIKDIVDKEIDDLRPGPKYAVVQQLDLTSYKAQVIYVGDPPDNPVWIPMPGIQPTGAGQVVRIEGPPGDRIITAVEGQAKIADSVQIAAPVLNPLQTSVDYTYPNVIVSWLPGDPNSAAAYMVQYRPVGVTNFETRYTPIGATSIRLYPLAKDTQYEIQVTALGAMGGTSKTVSALITTGHDSIAPSAPTGLAATPSFMGFRVTWNDNSEPDVKNGAGSYRLQVATSSAFTTIVTDQRISGLVANVVGLLDNTTYWMRVYARDTDGNQSAAASSTVSATTLPLSSDQIPTIPGSKLKDGVIPTSSPTPTLTPAIGMIQAIWPAISNADPVTYEVHVSTTSGFTPSGATKVTETLGLFCFIRSLPGTSTPLSYGTQYYVRIIAKDLDGAAAPGTQANTAPLQVTGPDIVANAIVAGSSIIGLAAIGYAQIGSVDAATITVGYLDVANRIQASAIGAEKLLVFPGGGNKVRNSTFALGDLSYWVYSGTWYVRSNTAVNNRPGDHDVYAPRSDGTVGNWWPLTSQQFGVTPGGKLSCSFWYYLDPGVRQTHAKFNFYDTYGGFISSWFAMNGTDNTTGVPTGWIKVQQSGTNAIPVPYGSVWAEFEYMAGWSATNGVNAYSYFGGLMVTAGDILPDWLPSPEEITPGTFATNIAMVSGYIQSTSFLSGSYGWRINADGSAEFVNVTVSGYIKATTLSGWMTTAAGGGFRTAATGTRITIDSSLIDQINFYTGLGSELVPAFFKIYGSGSPNLSINAPWVSGLTPGAGPGSLDLYSDGRCTLFGSITLYPYSGTTAVVSGDFSVTGTTTLTAPTSHTLSLANGWSNGGGTFRTARWYQDAQGFVHIEAYLTGGTYSINTTIATGLPAPSGRVTLPAQWGDASSYNRFDVDTSGNLILVAGAGSGGNAYLAINGTYKQ